MIVNIVRVKDDKIEVKPIDFEELITRLVPGNPESYDKLFEDKPASD